MGLITKQVEVKWTGKIKNWYVNKGYEFTKMGDAFIVDIHDLTNGSNIEITYLCDICGIESKTAYYCIVKRLDDEILYCSKCSIIHKAVPDGMKTRLKNSTSFQQWCYNNLSKEKADEIVLKRWDYEKNSCSPDGVCFQSNNKYWFKCNRNINHKSIKRAPSDIIRGNNSIICNTCSSFGMWCEDNNRTDLLELWDNENNNCSPYEISFGNNKHILLRCHNKTHASHSISVANITKNINYIYKCKECNSFYRWCVDNNRHDLLNRWDYELNDFSPHDITYGSGKNVYLKCNNNDNHKSVLSNISNITTYLNWQPYCIECNSFEQYCKENKLDDILARWDYELNNRLPSEVSYGSSYVAYFICTNDSLHKRIKSSISNVIKNKKLICIDCLSFKMWCIDNDREELLLLWDYDKNNCNPEDVRYGSNKDFYFKCSKDQLHESIKINLSNLTNGHSNLSCKKCRSFGAWCEDNQRMDLLDLWSIKNKFDQYHFTYRSGIEIWWKCENNKHDDYKRSLSASAACEYRCPSCMNERQFSMLQGKVADYLTSYYGYAVKHEYGCSVIPKSNKKCTNPYMPFDNEVSEFKLIIEVHGTQHYKICSWHKTASKNKNTTPELELKEQKERDLYKKKFALSKGYYYLEIPFWTEDDESYKILIDNKINSIMQMKV